MNHNKPLARHSRAGGNPDDKIIPREVGQHCGFVRYAECLFLLDSRLMKLLAIRLSWQKTPAKSLVMRGNDVVLCKWTL